jgi:hypothetical protein
MLLQFCEFKQIDLHEITLILLKWHVFFWQKERKMNWVGIMFFQKKNFANKNFSRFEMNIKKKTF